MFRTIVTTRSQGIQMNKYMRMLNFMFSLPGDYSTSHSSLHMESYMHIVWLSGGNICELFIDFDVQLLSVLHNSDS